MTGTLSDAVRDLIDHQIEEVEETRVAAVLAAEIVARDQFEVHPAHAIEAGVAAAIEEIDDETFDAAFDELQDAVATEIEGQAKAIALRLIRQLAADAARKAAAAE
jgi:hypothetical protein